MTRFTVPSRSPAGSHTIIPHLARERCLILLGGQEKKKRVPRSSFSSGRKPRFTGLELREAVEEGGRGRRRERGRRNRARAAAAAAVAAEKFAFHPFQRWHGPFIRSANQFESASRAARVLSAFPDAGKARSAAKSRCKAASLSLTGPFYRVSY